MIPLRAMRSLSGAVLLGALYGLFAAPAAQAADDARRATPPPGKALVFVFRSEREPVSATVPVSVNGARIGDLANGTFATATVNPGTTFLRSGDRVLTTLALEAEANKSYFVWVEAVPGVSPVRSEMRLVSESSGRRSIESSRFVGVASAAAVAAAPRAAQPTTQAAKPAAKPAAAAPESKTSTVSGRGWDIAIIPKAGVFELAEDSQVVGTLTSTYDTTASPALGIEVEWRSEMGFAVGGEIFYYSNDLTASGGLYSAEQEVLAFMVNGKYYFRAASWFYPFVGAGIGFTDTNYSGDLTGGASGLAYQALAGMEFRFKHFGVYLMGKYLASTTEDSSGEEVEVGGTGILAGVSFIF